MEDINCRVEASGQRRGVAPVLGRARASKHFPSISKFPLVFSKHFQRKRWRFCGISKACNRSKSKVMVSKFFWLSRRRRTTARSQNQAGSSKGHESTLAQIVFFRKRNRR